MILSAAPSRLPTFNSCPPGQAGLRLTDSPVKKLFTHATSYSGDLAENVQSCRSKPAEALSRTYFKLLHAS